MDFEESLVKKILKEAYPSLNEASIRVADSYAAQKEWGLVARTLLGSALRSNLKISPNLVRDAISSWGDYEIRNLKGEFAEAWLTQQVLVDA